MSLQELSFVGDNMDLQEHLCSFHCSFLLTTLAIMSLGEVVGHVSHHLLPSNGWEAFELLSSNNKEPVSE